jgi:hypothetical protein
MSVGTMALSAASPSLSRIFPRGAQRGTEADIEFHGARLADAQEILFFSPGFSTVSLEADGKKVKARLKIAPDCRLGVHGMRVRTASGITELRTFFVGALPNAKEKEPNSDFSAPQAITLNSTVAGRVDNEDVDYYVFEAKKGQRISVEIEAMRLGLTIFDSYIAILDDARFELAASDDSALLLQDSTCQAIAPKDGKYYVQVRESSYGGNGNCHYRLHVGTFPRPSAVYPAGGKAGVELEIRYIGDAAGAKKETIKVPAEHVDDYALFMKDDAGVAPSGNVFRISPYDNTLETEPNDRQNQATVGVAPGVFNGIISKPGDIDYFRFKATKGQTLEIECYARRLRSPLDSVMGIRHFGGGGIAGNDDSRGPDSYFRFTAPETKEYVISVRDHLRSGGEDFVYRIELTPVKPKLSLAIPRVARYSQARQSIAVPRGNRYTALISASRQNFGGDLALTAASLPPGVSIECETMPSSLSSIPVLFKAKADAPIGGQLSEIVAKHVDPKTGIQGDWGVGIDLLVGNPGQSIYLRHRAEKLAVAVVEEAPFQIKIVEPKVPLVRSGSMALKVVAERKEGFDAPIALEMVFNPPGVSSARGVTIPKGKNEAYIAMNANGGAPTRAWKIAVNGSADAGKGAIWVSTPFATLSVAQPYLTLSVQKTSVEQAKDTEFFCKVTQITKFSGTAKIRLQGLPHKVTSTEMEVTSETTELTFAVKVAKDSPAGRHKNVFCRVEIVENGESIVHSTGGTELRIDKPLPPPKPKKPKPKVAKKIEKPKPKPKPKPPAAKRLTRLEKLRLEFEKRKQEAEGGESPDE